MEAHQPGGIAKRQRLEEQPAHDAEHAGRRADRQRERENHDDGEARRAHQQPEGAAEVLA